MYDSVVASRMRITSRQNAWIRRFRKALDRHRDEIVLEGPRFVLDVLNAGFAPLAVAVREGIDWPSEQQVRVLEIESSVFDAISESTTSQGVLALFDRPTFDWHALEWDRGPLVVLDGVQDPGNVGTIVRLCAAFDACGLVCTPASADPYGPKSLRASAGAILGMPLFRMAAAPLLDRLAEAGARRVIATARGGTRELPGGRIALVFGSEGAGVSPDLARGADQVTIPSSGRVESLNVASAAAILLARAYEERLKG